MIRAIKAIELRDQFKAVCDKVVAGDTLIITRPRGDNVVLLSEKEYNRLLSGLQRHEGAS